LIGSSRSGSTWPPRDEEELLVLVGDLLDGGDDAGLLALERDQADALAAAVLLPELRQRDRLP
jgi:hypothetical protein